MDIRFAPLFSSSSGNSTFVGAGDTKVLVDAGVTGKNILQALDEIGERPEQLDGILVTHEHSDHIKGIGILSRRLVILSGELLTLPQKAIRQQATGPALSSAFRL